MFSIVIKLSHLFILCQLGVHAVPIPENIKSNFRAPIKLPKFEIPKNFNLSQVAQELKEIGVDSLKEEKHLEGLPLDRQGKVNPEFHKEIFLGNHELFENEIRNNPERRKKKLEEIFNKADVNKDSRLSNNELLDYVMGNVQEHLLEAKQKNSQLFLYIDDDKDGKVTWHEYFALYVKFHHVNESMAKASENLESINEPFDQDLQRELVRIRYRWIEADVAADNDLTLDEFLNFRHPEIAGNSYKSVVDDIILQMDRNGDEKLTIAEFAFLPSGVLEDESNKEWVDMDKNWLEEQKREFREMDINSDGELTREELLKAYDPMNRVHIEKQIKRLFSKVDDSPHDNVLSLDEIQNHADVFTDMHILDTDKALHDEM